MALGMDAVKPIAQIMMDGLDNLAESVRQFGIYARLILVNPFDVRRIGESGCSSDLKR